MLYIFFGGFIHGFIHGYIMTISSGFQWRCLPQPTCGAMRPDFKLSILTSFFAAQIHQQKKRGVFV